MNNVFTNRVARCAFVLVALLAFMPCVRAQSLPAQVRALESHIDFGATSPEPGHEGRATLTLVVSSPQPWSLSATLLPDRSGNGASFGRSFKMRDTTGNWVTVGHGAPSAIATGTSTPASGQVMTFAVEIVPTWDQAPGVRELDVRFALSDGSASEDVRVICRIDAASTITSDPREYSVTVPDPSRPGLFPFETGMYHVTSNVPWRLTATLAESPRVTGSAMHLGKDAVVVKVDATRWVPVPVDPDLVTVATGSPTGSAGTPVQVEFALKTQPAEIGGKYSAPLKISAEPLTPTGPK